MSANKNSDPVTPTNEEAGNSQTETENAAQPKKKRADPVQRFAWPLLTLILLLFVWYVLADR